MIYNVKLYFNGDKSFEVEARDEEHAEELAMEELEDKSGEVYCEVIDAVVIKSDNQYTDEQELRDGDRRRSDG